MLDRFTSSSKWRLDMKPVFRPGLLYIYIGLSIMLKRMILNRYFEGIQGDNAKKGELFGINNIFKLHEDKLATKMAVSYFLGFEKKKNRLNVGRDCGLFFFFSRLRRRIWQNWIGHWPIWMDREVRRE